MEVSKNKVVKINYKGTLSDGSVFDSNEDREPLEYIQGIGMIIPGLEQRIEGLQSGDKKSVEVPADEAYGQVSDDAVQDVPKDQFPQDIDLQEGMQLAAQGPQGMIPVTVKEIKDDSVLVDFNHPLAGKDLTFDVEVVDVRDATEDELEQGLPESMQQEQEQQSEEEEEVDEKDGSCGHGCGCH